MFSGHYYILELISWIHSIVLCNVVCIHFYQPSMYYVQLVCIFHGSIVSYHQFVCINHPCFCENNPCFWFYFLPVFLPKIGIDFLYERASPVLTFWNWIPPPPGSHETLLQNIHHIVCVYLWLAIMKTYHAHVYNACTGHLVPELSYIKCCFHCNCCSYVNIVDTRNTDHRWWS